MSNPYIGEIRCFSFNFAPVGWATCDGQILAISQNSALFAILGTNYGGNGTSTFGLPNMQGCVPSHWGSDGLGNSYFLADFVGEANHTLSYSEMAAHTHTIESAIVEPGSAPERIAAATTSASIGPSNPDGLYSTSTGNGNLSVLTLSSNGGSQPHNNLQPYLVLNFCIALEGIFPTRN